MQHGEEKPHLRTCSQSEFSPKLRYGKWTHGIFEKLGDPRSKAVHVLGNSWQVYYKDDMECAKKYGKIWGSYEFRKPMLAVMDPDMVKAIIVKECFTYFTNRRNFRLNGDLYDAISIVEDDEWRRIRHILTPSFTSGRIKEMFSLMKHHSSKLTTSLQSKACNNEVITVKDFFGAYSMDVMASCAFSVDVDSINNPSHPLIKHASKLFKLNPLLFIFQGFFPVREERDRSSHQNADLLQHMINSQTASEAKKEKQNKGLTDHEIVSQATMFMFADRFHFPKKGSVQYEELMQMEYLDSVVNECLRLYPPAGRLERIAKETVKISGITIPKDMLVMVPVYALHRDPELWPEPEEFRPDRFSKQNKQSINPYTYLPFGLGPRNCIGMRFALVLIKLAMVEVLQNYSFSVCKETEIPLIMDPEGLVGPLKPIKLKLVTR
ncbi:Cytochrome P450 3A27 [Dissostichus eleginoides]|uniref:unspecific monooxygenase n=1 Tax=Dissostichus eleginoides TaxID=100907 RepID=A0AAD9F2E4_DISEL|nr:Cytochrome P450 3A27 [Dissostichus eleginoides]